MKKIEQLNSAIINAEEALDEAKDARHMFLAPILEAAGFSVKGGISHCERSRDWDKNLIYRITFVSYCRGNSYEDIYKLPASVIEADDPVAAATAWKLDAQVKKSEQIRLQTLAEIERLQQSLK